MQLALRISKKPVASHGQNRACAFAVLDLDKAASYPANFICLLPRFDRRSKDKAQSDFVKLFGCESHQVAEKLLTQALTDQHDPNVKFDIRKRLNALRSMVTSVQQRQ